MRLQLFDANPRLPIGKEKDRALFGIESMGVRVGMVIPGYKYEYSTHTRGYGYYTHTRELIKFQRRGIQLTDSVRILLF